jgi:hypothetical protein
MQSIYTDIRKYIEDRITEFSLIQAGRKQELKRISSYIENQWREKKTWNLIFICTHNSRRSHFAQIWARVAADYYGLKNVHTFSGGTEATAFNPRAVKALENVGFQIEKQDQSENPVYRLTYAEPENPLLVFSKKYDHKVNPQKDFCAVMTCSEADDACPVVTGSDLRVSIPYEDPKMHDGTKQEEAKYAERCQEICREMFYALSRVSY